VLSLNATQRRCSFLQKEAIRRQFRARETEFLRLRRSKITIRDFDLRKTIGRGAFGEVKLAQKRDDGQIYAIKILRKVLYRSLAAVQNELC
jgi:serine/threonine kinase 38